MVVVVVVIAGRVVMVIVAVITAMAMIIVMAIMLVILQIWLIRGRMRHLPIMAPSYNTYNKGEGYSAGPCFDRGNRVVAPKRNDGAF
jgi:hypothetical protein